jgi:hypothetical protein
VSDERGDAQETPEPTFREAFAAAAKRSGFGQVAPGEAPSAGALLRAVGGVRGIIESVFPVLGFVVIYTITGNVLWSVGVPIAISLIFVLIRIVTRTPVIPALGGLALLVVSAVISLLTGQGRDNFLLGFWINGAGVVILVISLLVRRPFIGVIAGFLVGDAELWRTDRAKFRVAVIATFLWIGVFGLRLAVELPLYFANLTSALGAMKLILGVPLYATTLWVTWLLMRTAYARPVER